MSTYWHFECMDHDPPIQSDEFTQHTNDAHFVRGIERAKNRPVESEFPEPTGDGSQDYFDTNVWKFLAAHPRCTLEIASEYGERRPL